MPKKKENIRITITLDTYTLDCLETLKKNLGTKQNSKAIKFCIKMVTNK